MLNKLMDDTIHKITENAFMLLLEIGHFPVNQNYVNSNQISYKESAVIED